MSELSRDEIDRFVEEIACADCGAMFDLVYSDGFWFCPLCIHGLDYERDNGEDV